MIRSQIVTSLSKPCRRIHPHWRCFTFVCTFISFAIQGNGFTMAAANLHSSKTTESPVDPRESGTQLRPGLWQTINERYPGSMITKSEFIPLARLAKPLKDSTVCLISSCGVHLKRDRPMEVAHPLGDFSFRRVPSDARQPDLIIHQLKYPHDDADVDINVIFPIERIQDLAAEGVIGGLTRNFFSFIGYNMDPERFEATVAEGIARAVDEEERADVALLAPA
jgi:D-proline reductase (dithiol) PrdB